ncbi:MAG: hypothetical protein ACXWQO_10150 [Bdellovibrionota bacterium]
MLLRLFFAALAHAADDGAVNLNDLGFDGFTPYIMERNSAWIALPLMAIALLLLHLKRNRNKKRISREK